MDQLKYFEKLGMDRDPFGTSADPRFFYPTPEHMGCIHRLEVSFRKTGGVTIILGDPGAGKTMLMKVIYRQLGARKGDFITGAFSRPDFSSEYQFLGMLSKTFEIETCCGSTVEYRNALHDFLFRKTIEEGKRVVLMIDKGQDLTRSGLKVLKGLLGYQFDGIRLFHLVIFSRMELVEQIRRLEGFDELVSLSYTINPLDPDEMKEVILHRLQVAGYGNSRELFDDLALHEIWQFSRGNPLKANVMCNNSLVSMTIREARIVGPETVRSVARNWRI